MDKIKVWPHLTIVAVLCALASGAAVALWMKHQQKVAAAALPDAARIQRVDGEVALNNFYSSETGNGVETEWTSATPNQPFSVGDRIYTRDHSRAGLAFSGRNFARLNPNTSLDVLELADRRTQLALRNGSAIFDVGYLAPGELFEVATPYGAVDLYQPGLYSVGLGNEGAIISVLSGLAQVVGLGGSGQISKGEMLTLLGQTAANIVLSRLDGNEAGYLLDDYYGYQYPQLYDGRYSDYNVYLNDPYYYDPYRRNASYQYVSSYIPGINDLDYYGDWYNVSGYGYGWRPRVDSSWVPYQQGYWMTDYPYGPTWVSTEPWGYAPYHYGRWASVGDQWYWIPDSIDATPIYSPALVAFIPQSHSNEIGWVPLGPGDDYVPRYYDEDWRPTYLRRDDDGERQFRNLEVPGAVTFVSVDDFSRPIDRRRVRRADREMLARLRPVLDPLALTPLRNAAIRSAWGRDKIDLPPGIRKKLDDTSVLTSTDLSPRFRRRLARSAKVEAFPEKARNQKLEFKDERKEGNGRRTGRSEAGLRPRNSDFALQRQVRVAEQHQRQIQLDRLRLERTSERNGNDRRATQADLVRRQQMRTLEQRRPVQIEHGRSRRPEPPQVQGKLLGKSERKREQREAQPRETRQPRDVLTQQRVSNGQQEWRRSNSPRVLERRQAKEAGEKIIRNSHQGPQRNTEERSVLRQQSRQEQPPRGAERDLRDKRGRVGPDQTSQGRDRRGKGKTKGS